MDTTVKYFDTSLIRIILQYSAYQTIKSFGTVFVSFLAKMNNKTTIDMKLILRNLMRIFRRFRTAMILNILGLAVAFTAFMLLMMQWDYDRRPME